MKGLLDVVASSGLTIVGLVLLIFGAYTLAAGRVNIGSLPEFTGLRVRLIGLVLTEMGAALWLLQLPA